MKKKLSTMTNVLKQTVNYEKLGILTPFDNENMIKYTKKVV
jgi:hypothetical protein